MMYDDAQALATPFLMASIRLFHEWSVFKILPHGKGTMDERQTVLDIIRILTGEENRFNSWDLKRDRKD